MNSRNFLSQIDGIRPRGLLIVLALWLAVMVSTPIVDKLSGGTLFPYMAALGVLAQAAVTLSALASVWPLRRILYLVGAVLLVAMSAESIGVATGWPFGQYHYMAILQPQIFGVPLLIPLAWMMMLPPAWAVISCWLLPGSYSRWQTWLFAAMGGLAFTVWDFYLDPQMVARNFWVWQQPGGYFGIPWINFAGWWLVSTLITLLIRPISLPLRPLVLVYSVTWLLQGIGQGLFWDQPGPAIVGLLAMGLFAIPALRHASMERVLDLGCDQLPAQEASPSSAMHSSY
ncbi:MAG: carotenoid biosynthesis protein [Chloroflexi bacterium]|nr:carotenoid biosynthesis protein [Chloroflexota bacterium]